MKELGPHPGCPPTGSHRAKPPWHPLPPEASDPVPMVAVQSTHLVLSSIYVLGMFHRPLSHHSSVWLCEGQKAIPTPCTWSPAPKSPASLTANGPVGVSPLYPGRALSVQRRLGRV